MRILSVCPNSEAGGSSKSLISLAQELKRKGHEISVVVPRNGYLVDILRNNHIDVYLNKYIVFNVWPTVSSIKDLIFWIPKLLRLILYFIPGILKINRISKKVNPDIIHSNSSIITCAYFSAKFQKITHVWHIREYVDKDFGAIFFPNKRLRIKMLKDTPSISITKEINNLYSLQTTGVTIYNGIYSVHDIKTINSQLFDGNKQFYLYVGKVAKYKGVTDLIKAYCKYYKRGGKKKLILCGSYDENYNKSLVQIINLHNVPENQVIFKKQVIDVTKYMNSACALIVPSFYEAFGRVSAEAMFNKCLIVVSNNGGLKEQLDIGLEFTHNEIGYRFDNISDLCEIMLNIDCTIADNEINKKIQSAYRTAMHYWRIESYANSCIEYFNAIIKHPQD